MDLEEAVEELYSLTPAEFTPARNDLAKQLKGEDRELSDRVKALRKPATAAWVVNMLVRHDAEEMTAVLDLGESLRRAQADLDGDALRELNRQRRRLISAVAGKGRGLARDLGQKVSEAVIRQVEETLHAAMIDTDAAAAVRTGVLVDPLDPAGLGNVRAATAVAEHTALGAGPAAPARRTTTSATTAAPAKAAKGGGRQSGLKAVPEPDPEERRREERRRAREEARRAVREAEDDLVEAQDELESRERKLSDLQARTLQVNGEIDELRRRIDELEDRLERLDERADTAREERDEAAEALALAQSAAEDARSRLAELSD